MNRADVMAADVAALFRARNPLLFIVTREEERVEKSLLDAAATAKYDLRFWDCAAGTTQLNDKGEAVVISQDGDPRSALNMIRDRKERAIWILRDMHKWLGDPIALRSLRNLARTLPLTGQKEARGIVILTPSAEVPPELAGHAVVVEWPLPDREEIASILDNAISALPDEHPGKVLVNGTRESAIDAAVGLTAEEASSCYAKSLVTAKRIDPKAVSAEKKRVIARERVLEWFDPDPRGLAAVGGLENLKSWLTVRRSAFSQRAREFGLPAPKGVMLVGVPGCGKSLTAKAVASAWGVPLLRLDLGALKSKWVGESEANIRKALQVAETVAPCIVWLDEIEKALGGAIGGAADGGVSSDALGTILNWMQERKSPCFVVATANDVTALPPELMRKGRFDEVFFVDAPTDSERRDIAIATLKQFNRAVDGIDMDAIVAATEEFTGAEVSALVPEALFSAFADGERALKTEDLVAVAKTVVPLVKTAKEKIQRLREWAKERARPATPTAKAAATTGGRKLDL